MTAAQRNRQAWDVALRNVGLIHCALRRRRTFYASREDLLHEGMLALHRAAMRFRPELGYQFSSFAFRAIDRRILSAERRARKNHRAPVRISSGMVEDRGVAPSSDLEPDVRELIAQFLGLLPARERDILERLYGLNGREVVTATVIAEETGRSRQHISEIKLRALARMRTWAMAAGL